MRHSEAVNFLCKLNCNFLTATDCVVVEGCSVVEGGKSRNFRRIFYVHHQVILNFGLTCLRLVENFIEYCIERLLTLIDHVPYLALRIQGIHNGSPSRHLILQLSHSARDEGKR